MTFKFASKFTPNDRKVIVENILFHLFRSIETKKHKLIMQLTNKNFLMDGFRHKGECYLINPPKKNKVLRGKLPILPKTDVPEWEEFLTQYTLATTHRKKTEWLLAEILGKIPDAYSAYLFFPESLQGFTGINKQKLDELELAPILSMEEIQQLRDQYQEKLQFLEAMVIMKSVLL